MQMISATLGVRTEAADRSLPAGVAVDLLWAAARPEDRLEHVYCEPADGRLDFVFFVRSLSVAAACDAVAAICRRATATAPALRGWDLTDAPCRRTARSRR